MIRAACAVMLLAGCHATPDPAVPVRVEVPVIVPCIPPEAVPKAPDYLAGRGAYPGDAAAAGALVVDFERAKMYGAAWEAAAAGCIQTPASAAPPL